MCTIAESNVLLRAQTELPAGFKVATDEFREGWNRIRAGGAGRLEKKVQTRGWNFIKIADGALRSGVGETSQQAIASALKLALRRVDADSNAVEVRRIELTHYPWFVLARVCVHPYRIQQGAVLPVSDEGAAMSTAARKKRLSPRSAVLFPEFGCAMPMLKEMLIAPRTSEARAQ
ncbi:MAG TPA: hypothetical protein VN776_09375 [Terracidiphilus sp.]|nr:hypothetical protein [Terracidiphilus sp.]